MSKYAPAVGDTSVVGQVDFITTNPLGTSGVFDANVTANGYQSTQQDKKDPQLRFPCPVVPAGLNSGDWVTVDILQGDYAPYAGNIQAL